MTKAVILAGGFGTRISEETMNKPKPMVEVGGMPVLWHIMKIYEANGIHDFVICLGYRGHDIKSYFQNYALRSSDLKVDLGSGEVSMLKNSSEDWRISLIDTGSDAATGGRLKAIAEHLDPDEPFCMTYGDGVGDVNVRESIQFHKSHGKKATVTAITPPGRFGVLDVVGDKVLGFKEKLDTESYLVNSGFFVLHPSVVDYIEDEYTPWELSPMERLAHEDEMRAWHHTGFWMPMDTLRDKNKLEEIWASGNAPWKVW